MLTARSPAIPGSRFFPEVGTLLSSPCLTQLSPLGQIPPCFLPGSVFPLLSYQESDQMALGAGPPSSHIFQAEMEDLFFAGLACEGWAFLYSRMTPLTPRALAMIFSVGLTDVC